MRVRVRVRGYIAGPMTGYENFNREALHKVEEELKREGHTVLNPAVIFQEVVSEY